MIIIYFSFLFLSLWGVEGKEGRMGGVVGGGGGGGVAWLYFLLIALRAKLKTTVLPVLFVTAISNSYVVTFNV